MNVRVSRPTSAALVRLDARAVQTANGGPVSADPPANALPHPRRPSGAALPFPRKLQTRRHPQAFAADGTPCLPFVDYDDDGDPCADDEPMAENYRQGVQLRYAWPALEVSLLKRFPDAFVASDIFLSWRDGGSRVTIAPDIMVALGAGQMEPDSYKIHAGLPVPDFILEVLSRKTADKDLGPKRRACEKLGVREYWTFDPSLKLTPEGIVGNVLRGQGYEPVPPLPGTERYRSPLLGLEFRELDGNLRIFDPYTGLDLETYAEIAERADTEQQRAENERQRADAAEAELARLKLSLRHTRGES